MSIDATGVLTNTCPGCFGNWFSMTVAVEKGEVIAYLHAAECINCGTKVTIADPIDYENNLA